MSYSRWSHSVWYTYWSSSSPGGFFSKKDQIFEICDSHSYFITYREIVQDVDKVLQQVKEFYSVDRPGSIFDHVDPETKELRYIDWIYPAKNPTDEELAELKEYLLMFVADMDNYFKPLNWLKYEVYYPIRNKIAWWYRGFKKNQQ